MTKQLVLLLFWAAGCLLLTQVPGTTPLSASRQTKQKLFTNHGQEDYASQLSSYEIITPIKVTETGGFLSHDLTHTHEYNKVSEVVGKRGRRKRETQGNGINEEIENQTKVHYSLQIDGETHMVQLQPNNLFLAPHAVVERRSKFSPESDDGTTRIGTVTSRLSVVGTLPRCHFVGRVFNHTYSKVALSTCDGLKGLLKTNKGEYLIEPLKGFNRTSDQPHPHMIYHRSLNALEPHLSGKEEDCGAKNFEKALREREMWEEDRQRNAKEEDKEEPKRRSKRSVSVERNVEVLVVADKKMIDFYSNEDLNTYILTIMNMVSSIYHDASIGNAVNIIVVRIMLLETPQYEEELDISHVADDTLVSFCQWQQMVNPSSEDHPHHHDVAVLLTRYNICSRSNTHCSTLGLAEIAGMCQPHRSCNVNEDTGLQIAYTIAHEIGHNFGMNHDSPVNGCGSPYGVSQHVMSPHLATDTVPATWSNCSRNEITNFLDREWGTCLVDQPHDVEYNFPELPPGAMYDANHQCRLAFGANAYHCKGIEMECQTLWCRVDNRCVTRLEPAAEGTQCGKHKWCYFGKCVTMGERPAAIHGSWGQWSSWSSCSRSCGAGVEVANRLCDNPPPANGGKYCTGDRRRYRICNTEKCPDTGVSFRAVQCSLFDNKPYKGKNHTWGPVTLERSPCQLHCKPDNEFYSVELKDSVVDGTPCKPGTRDMCIHGVCKRVSCDWTIEGTAQEDRCGLCHGDGTQCVTTEGLFNVTQSVSYVRVVTFPVGARKVRVEEMGDAANYLAVKDEAEGKFYLNGNWIIQWSGEYSASGVMMYYKRENETETLFLPGPLKSPLTLMLLFQTDNPGLKWEYTLPHENATYTPEFNWHSSDWSVCTRTCGGGIQLSKAQCMEKEAGLVEDKYCEKKDRPEDRKRACNIHACPAWWWSGPWQPCSITCGSHGNRRRTVICVRSYGPTEQMALMDSDCSMTQKPHEEEECPDLLPCLSDLSWNVGPWIETCRGDPCEFERREIRCNAARGPCDPLTRPPDVRQCGNITCGHWEVGDWGKCSTTCGEGVQIRNVQCVSGTACTQAKEPGSVKECKLADCHSTNNNPIHSLAVQETLPEIYNEIEPKFANKHTPDLEDDKTLPNSTSDILKPNDESLLQVNTSTVSNSNESEQVNPYDKKVTEDELPKETSTKMSEERESGIQASDRADEDWKDETRNVNNTQTNTRNLGAEDKGTTETDDDNLSNNSNETEVANINKSEFENTEEEEGGEEKEEKEEEKGQEQEHEQGEEGEGSKWKEKQGPGDVNMREKSKKADKEPFGSHQNNENITREDLRHSSDISIGDSDGDSPSYYEATPDEYYEFDPEEDADNYNHLSNKQRKEGTKNAINENLNDIKKDTKKLKNNRLDLEADDNKNNNNNSDNYNNNNNNNNNSVNESQNETEAKEEHFEINQNNTEEEHETNENKINKMNNENVSEEMMRKEQTTNKESNEREETIIQNKTTTDSGQRENKNDSYDYYNDEEYHYDDFYNYKDEYDNTADSNKTTDETLIERPQGIIEDKLDIDGVQVIEIRLKKSKKGKKYRHHKRTMEEKIKKIKIHTGVDAIKVLRKIAKKANVKKTTLTETVSKSPDSETNSFIPIYKWTIGLWSKCSEPCGGGVQRRAVECQNSSSGAVVPPWECHALPPPDLQHCNKFRCLNWTVSAYGLCSATCGSGTRSRNASCPEEGKCHGRDLPQLHEECAEAPCVQWVKGPWSMCTKSCGGGYQIRFVKCVDVKTQEASQDCEGERPPHKRICNANKCQKRRQGQQNNCKDLLDTKLCRRLVHMCSTKFFRVKCCRTCHRRRG